MEMLIVFGIYGLGFALSFGICLTILENDCSEFFVTVDDIMMFSLVWFVTSPIAISYLISNSIYKSLKNRKMESFRKVLSK